MEEELGTRLPEGARIVAVEETADTIYLVLPITPTAGREGAALSDRELESVAGGCQDTSEPECLTALITCPDPWSPC